MEPFNERPPLELNGKQTRMLRSMGHHLRPVVTLGKEGFTEKALTQLKQCLTAHELVKIKILETCPINRTEASRRLAQQTGASLVQVLGRTILLYLPHPDKPVIHLP
ncbi:MAG: ribosome assembly RNA-binding protein YhbY [Deltaproteobacteria bacterium]|nr:ribosome assembly RNA-binding protein YhbY [Deltaproteobacteria bacterium]